MNGWPGTNRAPVRFGPAAWFVGSARDWTWAMAVRAWNPSHWTSRKFPRSAALTDDAVCWGWYEHLGTDKVSIFLSHYFSQNHPCLCLRHPLYLSLFPALMLGLSFLNTLFLFLVLCRISRPFAALYSFPFIFHLCLSGGVVVSVLLPLIKPSGLFKSFPEKKKKKASLGSWLLRKEEGDFERKEINPYYVSRSPTHFISYNLSNKHIAWHVIQRS